MITVAESKSQDRIIRINMRARRQTRDILLDQVTLIRAMISSWRLSLRGRYDDLIEETLTAYRAGNVPQVYIDPGHLVRLTEILAASTLAARMQVRETAHAAGAPVFAEVFPREKPPLKAIEWIRDLQTTSRELWDALLASKQRAAFFITGIEQRETLRIIQDEIGFSLQEGLSLKQFEERIRARIQDLALSGGRLRNVWHNNVTNSYNASRYEELAQPEIRAALPYFLFDAIVDSVVRPNHAALEGGIAPQDWSGWEEYRPMLGFNCFVPETPVSGRFMAGLKAWYTGPICQIETQNGRRLTVTVNHPVLSSSGWRRADDLCEGNDLVCYGREVDSFAATPRIGKAVDHQHVPSSIEDVFNSISSNGTWPINSRISPLNLHGDGEFLQGDIHIVAADGLLDGKRNFALPEDIDNGDVKFSRMPEFPLSALRPRFKLGIRNYAIPAGYPSGTTLPFNQRSILFDFSPFEKFSFRSATNSNSMRGEKSRKPIPLNAQFCGERFHADPRFISPDYFLGLRGPELRGSAQPKLVGSASQVNALSNEEFRQRFSAEPRFLLQLQTAYSGLVTLDQITRIRRIEYRGHVFDLESEGGWIVAGGVFTSNCRCSLIAITASRARQLLESGQGWDMTLGVPAGAGPDEGFVRMGV